jgi:hypothetical protein
MDPLPATAEALAMLAASGAEDLGTRLSCLCETVVDAVPATDAVAVWFADEDLTLVLVQPQDELSRRAIYPVMQSSLALKMATPTRVVSVVTVYSERANLFAGRVWAVERAVGAVWGASVVDDDVAFGACRRAGLAPTQLRARMAVDTAVGLLMGTRGFSIDEAEDWLDHVARTSGLTTVDVAVQVLAAHSHVVDP